MLLHDDAKQEFVSREKKDRRDFEQIAALASRMGLYRYLCLPKYLFSHIKLLLVMWGFSSQIMFDSHLYSKVAVFSKVPLPNYRFDLDDKRPQREVLLQFL